MPIKEIKKRDGRIVPFDREKITQAIMKAARKVGGDNEEIAKRLTDQVVQKIEESGVEIPDVEFIQDIVEKVLIENGHAKTAKEYILYRNERSRIREMNSSLMKTYEEITFCDATQSDMKRENANIDTNSPMGAMLKYGSEGAKKFNLLYLIPKDIADAHINGDIHIHDLDFYALTLTCCQIDLEKLFTGGFNTGHGYLREPSEIRSYAALACIAIQSNQNDMHGGQSIPAFDHYLAPGVAKTFVKEILRVVSDMYVDDEDNLPEWFKEIERRLKVYREEHRLIMNQEGYRFIEKTLKDFIKDENLNVDKIIKKARKHTENATYQAMEALIHNLNTMNSRAGICYMRVPEPWETLGVAV